VTAEVCRNCGTTVDGSYCGACGQAVYSRLSFRAMFRNSLFRLLDLDGGFLHTLVALSIRPGETIRRYVDGRRRPLTDPVSYSFLMVTLYALTINLLGVEISIPNALEFNDTERRVYHLLHAVLAYLIFVALWPVAALQRRLFGASGLSLAETYACCLYAFGHVNLAGAAFAAGGLLAKPAGIATLVLIQFGYYLWAITGFYRLARPPLLRGLVLAAVSFTVTNVLSLIVGNLIVAAGWLEPLESFLA